jgi:hypothetical protein
MANSILSTTQPLMDANGETNLDEELEIIKVGAQLNKVK